MQTMVKTAMPCEYSGRQFSRCADVGPVNPSRASEAARMARQRANSAPVLAIRHGKPTLLTMNNASSALSATARKGPSASPSGDRLRRVRQAVHVR